MDHKKTLLGSFSKPIRLLNKFSTQIIYDCRVDTPYVSLVEIAGVPPLSWREVVTDYMRYGLAPAKTDSSGLRFSKCGYTNVF